MKKGYFRPPTKQESEAMQEIMKGKDIFKKQYLGEWGSIMSENKPREFWLGQRVMLQNGIQSHVEFLIEQAPHQGFVHVIEYSAFEQLQKENDLLKRKLEIALGAIHRYQHDHNFSDDNLYAVFGEIEAINE